MFIQVKKRISKKGGGVNNRNAEYMSLCLSCDFCNVSMNICDFTDFFPETDPTNNLQQFHMFTYRIKYRIRIKPLYKKNPYADPGLNPPIENQIQPSKNWKTMIRNAGQT